MIIFTVSLATTYSASVDDTDTLCYLCDVHEIKDDSYLNIL